MTTDPTPIPGHVSVEDILATYGGVWPDELPRPIAATPHAAAVVLDITGAGFVGYASDFARLLCRLAFKADDVNRRRLRLAFPEMVDAVNLYERVGIKATKALADSEEAPS